MAPAVFKTVVGREERPGCVRFARASAIPDRVAGLFSAPRERAVCCSGEFSRWLSQWVCSCRSPAVARLPRCCAQETEVAAEGPKVAAPTAPVSGSFSSLVPAELPVWPEAEVTSAEEADGESLLLVLQTEDAYEDVVLGLGVGFERAGWQVAESGEEPNATLLDVSGSGYQGVVTISGSESGTSIEYLLLPTEDGAGA